jgi:hypothetical protein
LLIQKKTLVMKQDYWASIGCAVMQSSNTEVTTTTPAAEDCSLFCAQITPWVTLHSLPNSHKFSPSYIFPSKKYGASWWGAVVVMAGSWIHVRKTVCLCRICCKICFGCVLMAVGMCRLGQGRWIQLLFYGSLVQSLGMLRKSLPETESKTWKSSSSTESPSLRVRVYGLWILSEIMLSFWRPCLSTIVYSSLCKSGRTCIFQWSKYTVM